MSRSKPVFLQIIHHPKNESNLLTLDVEELEIEIGESLQIVGKQFIVELLRDSDGQLLTGKSKGIKGNLSAYEELTRTGVMPDGLIHELYLRETDLGLVLLQFQVPAGVYQNGESVIKTISKPHSLFLRMDHQMMNTRMRDRNDSFEETKIYFTPCMFGSDSAFLITQSGKKLAITDRALAIDEPIVAMRCNVDFSLYEREIIGRLVSVVNGLTFSGKISSITTTLPHGAYYSFLIEAAGQGHVSPSMMLEWFAMVDEKVRRIRGLIHKSVRRFNPDMPMDQYSLMDAACGVMRAYFMERENDPTLPVNVDELLQLTIDVVEAADTFVHQAFESGVPRPTSFYEFANLTYGLSVLRDMELKQGQPLTTKQIIAVYDIVETRAWYASKKYRNQNLLLHRGQFNNHRAQSTTYDHLSYICVQPIEPIAMELDPLYVQEHMGGTASLYNLPTQSMNMIAKRKLIKVGRI